VKFVLVVLPVVAWSARFSVILLATFYLASFTSRAQAPSTNSISLPTSLRINSSGWWPTKGEAERGEYAGSEACFACHESRSERQEQTAMFHAASRAADSKNLHDHPQLAFQKGPFSYQLTTNAEKSTLTATNGSGSVSVDLLWAFGSAHMGQTFVYQQAGKFFESRVSFFTERSGLDLTPGPSSTVPTGIENAAGRAMPLGEARACFACHTTASILRNQLEPNQAMLGVQCESCHGPGTKHVAAATAKTDKRGSGLIFNPENLSRVDSVDFCGACHRTWQDIVSSANPAPLINVRFAPYRLENSDCWNKGDGRIACVACHDPHKPLVHDAASYDANCLACHVSSAAEQRTANRPGAACPVATKNCVTCHMPKVEPPTLHSVFTDHWIRIAKAGSPYPE
jgi:hypothetical protein